MSTFQCECCGAIENTATSNQGHRRQSMYKWDFIESLRGLKLCYRCGPTVYRTGAPIEKKDWHGRFHLDYLTLGKYPEIDFRGTSRADETAYTSDDYVLMPTHYTVTSDEGEAIQLSEAYNPRRALIQSLLAGTCPLSIKDVGVYVKGPQEKAPYREPRKLSLLD